LRRAQVVRVRNSAHRGRAHARTEHINIQQMRSMFIIVGACINGRLQARTAHTEQTRSEVTARSNGAPDRQQLRTHWPSSVNRQQTRTTQARMKRTSIDSKRGRCASCGCVRHCERQQARTAHAEQTRSEAGNRSAVTDGRTWWQSGGLTSSDKHVAFVIL
jgi:hypothetical protein